MSFGSQPTTSRAEWLAARALLASHRLRRFVPIALGTFITVFIAVYVLRGPLEDLVIASQQASGQSRMPLRDTVPLATEVQTARQVLAVRDSTMRAGELQSRTHAGVAVLSAEARRERDSLRTTLGQLAGALDRAAKAPLPASYRALASTPALRGLGNVQLLVDTLDLLDQVRRTLDPVAAPQREFAQLSQRANAIGATLQGIGQARQAAMVRRLAAIEAGGAQPAATTTTATDTMTARAVRDSAWRRVVLAESSLREAKQWNEDRQSRVDSTARARAAPMLGASPAAATLAALVVLAVLGFTLAVTAEVRAPTIAHAREAERLTRLPVLGTVLARDLPVEGRGRLRPATGVNPFRMLYLRLTASGARERTVCIAGDDPTTVATVAGCLAVSAAADEHSTLIVDLASGTPSTSLYFGERSEPGFSEAMAMVRMWREVARPVGASEGLGLDLIPAGAPRSDILDSVHATANRDEFRLFAEEYDFTVVTAPSRASWETARILCEGPPTIYVARTGMTPLHRLHTEVEVLTSSGCQLMGVLLVDARLNA